MLLVTILFSAHALAAGSCGNLIDKAEATREPNAAIAMAKKAEAICNAEGSGKSSRLYLVMASASNQLQKFNDVVTYSKQALAAEPGLPLAYEDMCSGYMMLKQYDQAIEACKKGLAIDNGARWNAQLNFNLGLAIFDQATDAAKYADAAKAEPYFLAANKKDPSILQASYFIGVINEAVKMQPALAIPWYEKACNKGHKESCTNLARAKASVAKAGTPGAASNEAAAASAAPVAPASGNEATLLKQLEASYLKKGVDAKTASSIVANIHKSLGALPIDQRLKSLQSMVAAASK